MTQWVTQSLAESRRAPGDQALIVFNTIQHKPKVGVVQPVPLAVDGHRGKQEEWTVKNRSLLARTQVGKASDVASQCDRKTNLKANLDNRPDFSSQGEPVRFAK